MSFNKLVCGSVLFFAVGWSPLAKAEVPSACTVEVQESVQREVEAVEVLGVETIRDQGIALKHVTAVDGVGNQVSIDVFMGGITIAFIEVNGEIAGVFVRDSSGHSQSSTYENLSDASVVLAASQVQFALTADLGPGAEAECTPAEKDICEGMYWAALAANAGATAACCAATGGLGCAACTAAGIIAGDAIGKAKCCQ